MPRQKAVANDIQVLADGKKYLDNEGLAYLLTKLDAKYVEQVAGKGLSENDFTDEYKQMIDDLAYVKIAITAGSATNSSNEIGATVTETTVNFTLNKEPKTLKIKFGSEAEETLATSARSKTYTGKSVKENTNIVITATDERNATATRTVTISFQPKVYWGIADNKASYTSADILALESALASNRNRTFSVNAGAGKHIIYAIPQYFGTPTFNVGGFDGGFIKVGTIEHTNASGYKQNYDVWKSVNAGLGQTSVTVK